MLPLGVFFGHAGDGTPGALHMLGKCSVTELHTQPWLVVLELEPFLGPQKAQPSAPDGGKDPATGPCPPGPLGCPALQDTGVLIGTLSSLLPSPVLPWSSPKATLKTQTQFPFCVYSCISPCLPIPRARRLQNLLGEK